MSANNINRRCDMCACGGKSLVVTTRTSGATITRRRECSECGVRWSTWETLTNDDGTIRSLSRAVTRVRQAMAGVRIPRKGVHQ